MTDASFLFKTIFDQIQSIKIPTDYLNEEKKFTHVISQNFSLKELKENELQINNKNNCEFLLSVKFLIIKIFSGFIIRLTNEENYLISVNDGKKSTIVHVQAEDRSQNFKSFFESIFQNHLFSKKNEEEYFNYFKSFYKSQVNI
jgi:hypothetical protein